MEDLRDRTMRFAVEVIRFCVSLPAKPEYSIVGKQLVRAGSSVGANYRASRRAKSSRDFLSKMAIVEEEADESLYWLELLGKLGGGENAALHRLSGEADQLLRIAVACKKTARANLKQTAKS